MRKTSTLTLPSREVAPRAGGTQLAVLRPILADVRALLRDTDAGPAAGSDTLAGNEETKAPATPPRLLERPTRAID
jgi:hypothetical protein